MQVELLKLELTASIFNWSKFNSSNSVSSLFKDSCIRATSCLALRPDRKLINPHHCVKKLSKNMLRLLALMRRDTVTATKN